jgi:hypothetical protein
MFNARARVPVQESIITKPRVRHEPATPPAARTTAPRISG